MLEQWYSLDESSKSKYRRKSSRCPEPALSLLRPDVSFGSVSESFRSITDKYLQDREQQREDSLDTHRYREGKRMDKKRFQLASLKLTFTKCDISFIRLVSPSLSLASASCFTTSGSAHCVIRAKRWVC